ncbi:hypothetical protein JNUCC1_01167 [Lentibacillus sp. JNUCC-1]|uniref:DNA-directed RNA polymerase subunit beta n=1 Tax=Lentibacillus sp. JNUCC-1 TaxID=2654513 RepID=UPI001324DE1A|nr:hypothetical protein [Lentibacillus sp. JNUCC-1]
MKRRLLPIWLRLIIVLVLAVAALILGLGIGYSVLGDGSFKEIFDRETWQHIIDIVEKEK